MSHVNPCGHCGVLECEGDCQPEVSSNGNLREAAIKAALCLSGYVGEGISVDGFEEPETAYALLVTALGMPDADDDDLCSALGSAW